MAVSLDRERVDRIVGYLNDREIREGNHAYYCLVTYRMKEKKETKEMPTTRASTIAIFVTCLTIYAGIMLGILLHYVLK